MNLMSSSSTAISTLLLILILTSVITGLQAYVHIPAVRRSSSWIPLHNTIPNSSPDEREGHPSSSEQDPSQPISQQNPISSFGTRSPITASSQSSSYNGVLDGVGGILPLESIPPSPQRLDRMKREADLKSKFLHGDQLINLRQYMDNLVKELTELKQGNQNTDDHHYQSLSKALQDAREMDAEYMYRLCKENAVTAEQRGHVEEAKDWLRQATDARHSLPQFNLEGLWVGKYGDHGYEMINITYIGDTLVATKVTGDKNVPKGQLSFTTDLNPSASQRKTLKPIELTQVASKQWGQKYLLRFPGKGQVASEGFINREWMEGQLILVGDYFSFAWIPIGYQIFFGRPSAELTIKMLKQSRMIDFGAVATAELAEKRAFVQKCFDETEVLLDDECSIDGVIIPSNDQDDVRYLDQYLDGFQ